MPPSVVHSRLMLVVPLGGVVVAGAIDTLKDVVDGVHIIVRFCAFNAQDMELYPTALG